MTAASPLLRTIRVLTLILQLAMPSLGVIADARHEAETLAARVHVEAEDHECERGHPEHCALCQFLRAPVVIASGVQESISEVEGSSPAPVEPVDTGWRERLSSLPRGPPLLS